MGDVPAGDSPAASTPSPGRESGPVGLVLVGFVRLYQKTLSPLIRATAGDICRFEPSCSEYFILAVRKYGPLRGSVKGVYRILRCNPACQGGVDYP